MVAALWLTMAAGAVAESATLPVYPEVVGEEVRYRVQAGDSLERVAKRHGMKVATAAAVNRLADPRRLRIGQELILSNRRIVPAKLDDGLVINIAERMLYWFKAKQLVAQFPVAVGKADWETPPGRFKIITRRRKPTWHVPPSIQAEMRERGEAVKTKVPPGPDNPLGEYWLQLSAGDYGLHGTNAPWSVGKFATHGCIRLRPGDVERLFNEAPNGTPVWVVYEPIKLAALPDGHVLIEAYPDFYDRAGGLIAGFAEAARQAGIAERVEVERALSAISDAWGVPVDVTRPGAAAAADASRNGEVPNRNSIDSP